jgi:hypothetical protein
VRISPQPPLRTTGAYWKGGTTTTSGCGGLVLPVDYDWLMGDPFFKVSLCNQTALNRRVLTKISYLTMFFKSVLMGCATLYALLKGIATSINRIRERHGVP